MKASELLEASLELLNGGENWTKGAFVSHRESDQATCFCAVGAIRKSAGFGGGVTRTGGNYSERVYAKECAVLAFADAVNVHVSAHPDDGLIAAIEFNDAEATTWPDVEQAFTKAIYAARQHEGTNA